jgi:PilZ domain-containing protein
MSISETIDHAMTWATANLAIVIGGLVAIIALTVVCVMTRQRKLTQMERLAAAAANSAGSSLHKPLTEEKALEWEPPEQSYADRRGAVRREGTVVRVMLAAPPFRNGVGEGFVLDRSTGGLRIAVTTPLEPGITIQVRATNAPETVGFVGVLVRSCRKNGEFYELGCEFEKTPPWNVLLLFG